SCESKARAARPFRALCVVLVSLRWCCLCLLSRSLRVAKWWRVSNHGGSEAQKQSAQSTQYDSLICATVTALLVCQRGYCQHCETGQRKCDQLGDQIVSSRKSIISLSGQSRGSLMGRKAAKNCWVQFVLQA